MNRSHLLYRLQTIDLEITNGKRRLEEVKAGLGESEELRQARRALQKAGDELNHWRTTLRDLELGCDFSRGSLSEETGTLHN